MTYQLDIEATLSAMTSELQQLVAKRSGHEREPRMVGIQTGGVWIAERLHQQLGLSQPLGRLDISFYRDDFTQKGLNPSVKPSALPFAVEGETIILVDDVFMSGRTVRAALNELFDYGRPAHVFFAVLIDLQSHELPIQPDVVGRVVSLPPQQRIKLRGPDPLRLDVVEIAKKG